MSLAPRSAALWFTAMVALGVSPLVWSQELKPIWNGAELRVTVPGVPPVRANVRTSASVSEPAVVVSEPRPRGSVKKRQTPLPHGRGSVSSFLLLNHLLSRARQQAVERRDSFTSSEGAVIE